MYLSGNQQVQRSMNGLLKIKASQIDAKNANLTNINNVQNINGKPGEDIIITPDGGLIDLNGNVGITGTLDVSGNSVLNGLVRVDGEIRIYDPTNVNSYIRLFHDISSYGFKFQLESPNQIMYFKVKNGTNPGDYKTFYFSANQLYNDIYFYLANNMTVEWGKVMCFGDYNNGNPYGGTIKFIASSNPWDGWQFQNNGLQPAGQIYYTNFSNYNLAGVETQTLRMNYNNVWSLVPHTFNSTITVAGTATLNGALNVNATTNLSTTYFNGQISALYITNFYANVYLFSTAKLFVNGTTGITQNELSYLSGVTSNIQTQLNGKLSLTGGTMTGALVVNNTITTNNNIIQNSSTASNNKITQSIINNDVTGNANTFKYSMFSYDTSGTTTASPCIACREITSNNSMYFFPKLGSGAYNPITRPDDRGIFSFFPQDNNAITLTAWATLKLGIRVVATSSTAVYIDMWAKNCNLKLDSSNNILMSANNSTSSNPDVSILNSGSARGIQFIANASASASNTLVALNDAVITTQTQNNSSLVLTNYGTIKSGLKISCTSASNSNVGLYCGSSYIKLSKSASETMDFISDIISFAPVSGYNLTSPENIFITSNNLYPCKFRALTHEFAKQDGSDGCTVNIKGDLALPVASTKITFPDASIQNTAYTNTLNTKLNAIGGITTSTLNATTTLTSGTFFNCGLITLSAGTYMLTLNCCMAVITGSTTVGQILIAPSTSSTGLSANTNLSIVNGGTISYGIGAQWILTTSAIVAPTTSTTYYMVCQVLFGTVSRMEFNNGNSKFQAVRIA